MLNKKLISIEQKPSCQLQGIDVFFYHERQRVSLNKYTAYYDLDSIDETNLDYNDDQESYATEEIKESNDERQESDQQDQSEELKEDQLTI